MSEKVFHFLQEQTQDCRTVNLKEKATSHLQNRLQDPIDGRQEEAICQERSRSIVDQPEGLPALAQNFQSVGK